MWWPWGSGKETAEPRFVIKMICNTEFPTATITFQAEWI